MTGADRTAIRYARIALAAAFLSAVGSRLGVWGTWEGFESWARTDVLAFVPAVAVKPLLVAATIAEATLGLLLLVGAWPRTVGLAAAALLAIFALSMALSAGIRSPLEYSVFSASAAALLVARMSPRS
jgi:putative oxidoreductase